MRGVVSASNPWDVMVDLFFYRDPEETQEKEAEEGAEAFGDFGALPAPAGAVENWGDAPAPAEAFPAAEGFAPVSGFEAAAAPAPQFAAPAEFGGNY
jgi:small subunit ribosomal protein SAe